jgi:hypothetical protein
MRRNPRCDPDAEQYVYTAEQCAAQLANSFGDLDDYSQVPHDAQRTPTAFTTAVRCSTRRPCAQLDFLAKVLAPGVSSELVRS